MLKMIKKWWQKRKLEQWRVLMREAVADRDTVLYWAAREIERRRLKTIANRCRMLVAKIKELQATHPNEMKK